ncbi:APC10-domain-containing protein [Tothia fuscella]|uniref:APC10-domain-containing protein n=1 Tax=Tothia fuscella TaxID=1048955 RepID=A0A9P4NTR2_9PEZI|nr:APC10-domain-containing protein [Tothia fuscella]
MASGNRHSSHNVPEFLDAPADAEDLLSEDDQEVAGELLEEDEDVAEEDEEGVVDPAAQPDQQSMPPAPPPGLKEISPLASWTVSSSKPGCGVAALRAPNTALFWQSDGPQPHLLNIHFFKLVEIVGMRVYLNFDLDESYTPTLIRFAAGTGYNDLQEFSTLQKQQPNGWLEVDFEDVGEVEPADGDDDEMKDDSEEEKENTRRLPVLRCMLVQVRICENHQNGKDTHLRGLQLFARDSSKMQERMDAGVSAMPATAGAERMRKKKIFEVPAWATVPSLR